MAVKDSLSNSMDELDSHSEGKRATAKLPSSKSFDLDCHQKVTPRLRVGLWASDTLPRETPPAVCVFHDSRCGQVDNQD